MAETNDVAEFLKQRLEEVETRLLAGEAALEPIRDEARKLKNSLREYNAGTMGSGAISDTDIINWLRKNAAESPKRAPEIAAGMEIDTRGISRRLPRMAGEGLISGNAEDGYSPATPRKR